MTDIKLADLQYALQSFLLGKNDNARELTLETPSFSRDQRLAIYHQAYRLRLIDTLQNDFPALHKIIGQDAFIQVSEDYINAHPSQHPSLRWFGKEFSQFLKNHSLGKERENLWDLAEFEWAQVMAFDASDIRPISINALRELAPEYWMSLRLELHPSIQFLSITTNAPSIWNALIKENIDTDDIKHETNDAQDWLIWREELQVVYRQVSTIEMACLQQFSAGNTFEEVCITLCEWINEEAVPLQAAQFLQHWISAGMVTKIIAD
jgi:hypothetical protein